MTITRIILGCAAAVSLLSACSEPELVLSGERFDVRTPLSETLPAKPGELPEAGRAQPFQNRSEPAAVGAAVASADWTHKGGSPVHYAPNQALSAQPQLVAAVPIGQGNDRRHRISSPPVVSGGRVFTLDSRARVAATSTAAQPLWTADLTPPGENADDATGGGLAAAGGRLLVTTGFGELYALDAASGTVLWRQRLDAAATATPTVVGDTVYVVTRDNRGWALDVTNGRIRWIVDAVRSPSGFTGPAGPLATPSLVVFPFSSEELRGVRPDGTPAWTAAVSGARPTVAYSQITDVLGDPVLYQGVIYTGTQSGRTAAINSETGNTLWTATTGAYNTPVVTGNAVFVVSDEAELVRLEARSGEVVWRVRLPYYEPTRKVNRRRDVFSHFGPVLAGGRLWIASDDGLLRAFRPEDGTLLAEIDLPGGGASQPVVAGGTLWVLSGKGQLLAFR